ncbi:MAG: quinone-dependent dihydroorotate dehydrogenase [Anaerolineales bacterium]|nr:quinone-dependent dihydroorotate dehydrogenase [Anaerolineales bacterium]
MKSWRFWQGERVITIVTLSPRHRVMYHALRPLLFRLDPERAHALTLAALRLPFADVVLRALFEVNDPRLEVEAFGLRFRNRVGLAAGYDKNGVAVSGLAALGFGHIEVGTVTLLPQAGNPKPRVHRVPEAQALVNAMGFPNNGVEALMVESRKWKVLLSTRYFLRIGVNIGKGRDTPLERAAEDYCALLERVHECADYVALNLSSPNTPGLRQLQLRAFLEDLLRAVTAVRDRLPRRTPLLVKLAPDLTEAELDDALAAATACGVDGLIATNTTLSRDGLPARARSLSGGLSGEPLRARSTAVVRYLARRTDLPIIGVGGILCPDDALEKLDAGATLVQLYTGLVYSGPGLVHDINLHLLKTRSARPLTQLPNCSITQ